MTVEPSPFAQAVLAVCEAIRAARRLDPEMHRLAVDLMLAMIVAEAGDAVVVEAELATRRAA